MSTTTIKALSSFHWEHGFIEPIDPPSKSNDLKYFGSAAVICKTIGELLSGITKSEAVKKWRKFDRNKDKPEIEWWKTRDGRVYMTRLEALRLEGQLYEDLVQGLEAANKEEDDGFIIIDKPEDPIVVPAHRFSRGLAGIFEGFIGARRTPVSTCSRRLNPRPAPDDIFQISQVGLSRQQPEILMAPQTRSDEQIEDFNEAVADFYDAKTITPPLPDSNHGPIVRWHDTATGNLPSHYSARDHYRLAGVHLVPPNLRPEILSVLFDRTCSCSSIYSNLTGGGDQVFAELNTPLNSLYVDTTVAVALNDGAVVVVPDLPEQPTSEQISAWEISEPNNYKWKVLDPKAYCLGALIPGDYRDWDKNIRVRELDGQRLLFKNSARPRVEYLYHHYVMARFKLVLRERCCACIYTEGGGFGRCGNPHLLDGYWPLEQQKEGFWPEMMRGKYLNDGVYYHHDGEKVDMRAWFIAMLKIVQAQRTLEELDEEEEELEREGLIRRWTVRAEYNGEIMGLWCDLDNSY